MKVGTRVDKGRLWIYLELPGSTAPLWFHKDLQDEAVSNAVETAVLEALRTHMIGVRMTAYESGRVAARDASKKITEFNDCFNSDDTGY